MTPHRPARLAAVRSLWRTLIEVLRAAPITDAAKIVDEIRRELDESFPRRGEP